MFYGISLNHLVFHCCYFFYLLNFRLPHCDLWNPALH